jgi:hypothetical protein
VAASDPTVAQRTLQHRLADLPSSAFPHVRIGYTLLGSLNEQKLEAVVDYVAATFSKRSRHDPEVAAELSGIDQHIVGDLLSAVALTVGSVYDIDVSKEDFFDAAPDGLIDNNVQNIVGRIIDIALSRKQSLKSDFDKSKVSNSVLPSFRYIEYAIDVRLSFSANGTITDKVPVAVFYLDTDSTEEIWFQASLPDLDELVQKLTTARERLKSASAAMGGSL